MGSEPGVGISSGTKTPPRLCYHALPSQRREPLGMATPPLQAAGSVPFRWEVAPGKPRSTDDAHGRPKPASACRRLEPPPGMALLSASSSPWQVAKFADAEVPTKTVLGGPYYVLLPPSASLFDGPSVMTRSSSLSRASFRNYAVCDEGRRKERPAVWFWKKTASRRVEESSERKKGEAAAPDHDLPRSYSSASKRYDGDGEGLSVEGSGRGACHGEEAANVRITRFRRSGSIPNLSTASTHLWASIYGGLKQVVRAPWRPRKSPGKSYSRSPAH